MSTYFYLQCLDHNPPLTANDESGQHYYDLPRIQAEIAEDRPIVSTFDWRKTNVFSPDWDSALYFRDNSAKFLAKHIDCRIGIIDEYGVENPTVEDPATS